MIKIKIIYLNFFILIFDIILRMSIARQYANVNENMQRSYWDYDNLQIQWGVQDNYEVCLFSLHNTFSFLLFY